MKQYTIGDVSKRLGISRDSLRFYEKKGIISPQKLENGYRCYSYEDTRKLLDIMFYRRLNFSIEDINRILHKSSFGSYYTMIQEKIAEEEQEVERHRRSLIHLKYLTQLYKNIDDYLNRYDIRPLRRYYKADESLIDKLAVHDLCYIYQEYQLGEGMPEQVDEYYLFAADTAAIIGLEEQLSGRLFIQHEHCIYTVIASASRIPDTRSIMKAVCWARDHGYSLEGTAYSGFLLSCAVDEMQTERTEEAETSQPVYYIELYLPLKEL